MRSVLMPLVDARSCVELFNRLASLSRRTRSFMLLRP